ncbi:MAG: insecticidal toxin complex protein, partial [Chitinophagaceae bacterium]
EDLVPLLEKQGSNWVRHKQLRSVNGTAYTIKRYRPRIEGAFTRIEKWKNNTTGEVHWKTISASNFHSYYGLTPESRKADPADPLRVFEWMLCRGHDDKGNISLLQYKKEDFLQVPANVYEKNRIGNSTQLYLKKIYYGIKTPWYLGDPLPDAGDFMFQTVFDYGEHDSAETITAQIFDDTTNVWPCRKDPFSTYRSGFEIRTYRRCKRILTFHLFDELPINPCLVKSLELFYDDDLEFTGSGKKEPGFSYLVHAKHSGHIWRPATNSYSSKSLPELEIKYEQHAWNTEVTFLKDQNTIHALSGLQDKRYLWIDLFSEGISGILTEQAGTMYYKSNFGEGTFSAPKQVSPKPSFSGLSDGTVLIQELKGDGVKYLVQSLSEPKGFFKLGDEEDWEPMKNFLSIPNININDPNLRTLDLTGDGIADLLVSDGDSFLWYEGLGEDGFSVSKKIYKEIDEEKGPSIVFADREQSIFLVDMNGDGLTDIARIRNGEICFWPNLGFGKFGRKVAMANPPLFDHPDTFNPIYLRLADIDGSGTTDIIYLGKNDFRAWMNQNGNEWSTEPHIIAEFPAIHNLSDFAVFDFLGSGTACIVCSGAPDNQPAWYIDLMSGRKPHLFTGYQNNCGKEVSIEYKSSTHFYLEDKKAGRKWATKLPFPVHCIYKTKSEDKIRKTIFTSSYRYSHGYFDHEEREFRGFGRVEQLDSEEFSQFKLNDAKNVAEEIFHQPPVRTVSWFHTGAWLRNTSIIHQYKEEYFQNTQLIEYDLPDAVIPAGLSAEEIREAYRACKGLPLRVEVYANDNLAESIFPFTAAGSTAVIKIVQPRAFNKHAVFLVAAAESISYGYDRNPADPRISHSFILETNEFGMPLKTASIVYKRVTRPTGDQMIPDKVWEEQSKSHVVYDEANYTDDITEDDIYRLRVACESKSYEIGGIDIAAGTFITLKDLNLKIAIATEILFEQDFSAGTQKRLSSHGRNYFLNDHLNAPLALGKLSSLGLTYKSYQLAFTKGLIAKYYNTGTTRVPDSMLLDAKYIHSQGDQHWWTQSGETIFSPDARDKFYTVIGIKDVFGNESFVQYDQYIFLAKKTTDAIGNFSTVINDYRTLSPVLLTDPNLNRTAVETDEIGVTIKSALLGKEGMGEGDSLSDPTTRMEYDLMNWKNNGMPNYTHSFSREQHGNGNPRWQESYSYWDGGGAVIMVKNQVNGGTAKRWNATSKAIEEINTDSRWLGNGRTLYNNKGNPVKKYEPYFSTTHEYESEDALVETGMSPFMFYDAIGRNIRTEFPNGTFTKVEFDQWHSKSFDPIDTVKDSQWFIDRGSPNPTATEPLDPEHRAAWLALKHYNTPSVSYLDSAGKGVYSVADYGNGKKTNVYSQSDLTGRYSKLFDQLGRKVSESYVSLSGIPMYSKTAEKGERWILTDVLGRVVKVWDNVRELYATFDKLHRPVSTYIKEGARETLFSHLVYGDLFPDDIARLKNIKGRVYQLYDQGGVATITAIDFKGNPTAVERRLTKSYKQTIDWSPLKGINDINTIESLASVQLETEVFSSSTRLDALNRPMLVTLPDNSIVQPGYNERN